MTPILQESSETRLQKTEQYVEMVLMYLKLDAGAEDYVIRECSLDNIIKTEP